MFRISALLAPVGTNLFALEADEAYVARLAQVERQSLRLETRKGETPIYVFRPMDAKDIAPVHIYLHDGGFAREHGPRDDYCCARYALYTGGPELAASPFASLVLAPDSMLTGLPETVLFTAAPDGLRLEAKHMAQRLQVCGVPVTCKCFTKSRHGFIINCQDEWEEAQQDIMALIRA